MSSKPTAATKSPKRGQPEEEQPKPPKKQSVFERLSSTKKPEPPRDQPTGPGKAPRTTIRKARPTALLKKMKKYSKEELDSMRQHFEMIDTDGNGVLDRDEVAAFCKLYDIDSNFVDLVFKLFDTNHDEVLQFDEFVEYIKCAQQLDVQPRIFYKRLFDAIDEDHSGSINPDELVEYCRIMRIPITKKEATDVIKSMDYRGLGAIIFEDLCRWLEV